mmetsp:Transcript_11908/g.29904  ORF Transcript_11908/g.29904 Transcript_11908/m.29904 type:complete len:224 (+) Transcript_11908:111-782(+)
MYERLALENCTRGYLGKVLASGGDLSERHRRVNRCHDRGRATLKTKQHIWLDFASKFGPKSVGACVKHVAHSFRTLGRRASPWATPENLQDHLNVAKYRFQAHFKSSDSDLQLRTRFWLRREGCGNPWSHIRSCCWANKVLAQHATLRSCRLLQPIRISGCNRCLILWMGATYLIAPLHLIRQDNEHATHWLPILYWRVCHCKQRPRSARSRQHPNNWRHRED